MLVGVMASMRPTSGAGRFAPSPSGALHLGNLRTALAAWLSARGSARRFELRIEDIDAQRSRREHEPGQLADLRRLGLDWDGDPLRQSDRRETHRAAAERLRTAGRLYPCWCTRAEIRQAASAPHAERLADAYPGTCRHLDSRRRSERSERGAPRAWRLDGRDTPVSFVDRVHGPAQAVVDDFVVWRGDLDAGAPAYNLAVVVDDHDQGVDEVVRGDDLLATTSRQLLLARLLGLTAPAHAHVPLVLGPDGRRLAKRDGAVTLAEREQLGETPEDVLSWMGCTLGLAEPRERLDLAGLVERFDVARLAREPTTLDPSVSLAVS